MLYHVRGRLHISWFIAALATGILAGTVLSAFISFKLPFVELFTVAFVLFFIAAVKRHWVLLIAALLAGMTIGTWRGSVERHHLTGYRQYYGKSVTLSGKVIEDPGFGKNGTTQLRLVDVRIDDTRQSGTVWLSTSSNLQIKRGDYIKAEGNLSEGFGNMPAAIFRARIIEVERPYPGDVARRVRDWFSDLIRRGISDPEASLGIGYLTGQKNSLPESLDTQLRLLGLTHVVVASGYNLTILVRFTRRWLAPVSKYLATASAGGMIIAFMSVTGMSPSMSRAGLVAGLSLMARYYGRNIHPFVLLPVAAAITVTLNPTFMWGDIGWYLSFASFAGVVIFAPLVHHYFWGTLKRPGVIRQTVIDTMSAQIITLPIIAFTFGQYSPLALPANLLVLPFIPLAMLLTFMAGLAGLVVPVAAGLIALPATLLLGYMTSVTDFLGSSSWAEGEIKFNIASVTASYVLIIMVMVFLKRRTGHSFRKDNMVD